MPRSGFEIACTAIPAACSCPATSFQPELSAKAPWTRATVGREPVAASVMTFLLDRDDERADGVPPARGPAGGRGWLFPHRGAGRQAGLGAAGGRWPRVGRPSAF